MYVSPCSRLGRKGRETPLAPATCMGHQCRGGGAGNPAPGCQLANDGLAAQHVCNVALVLLLALPVGHDTGLCPVHLNGSTLTNVDHGGLGAENLAGCIQVF